MLHVFTGKDGSYTLFEDDGLSEGYRKGQSAQVPVTWSEATKTLTIGARQGSFPGMVAQRAMSVRFHTPGKAVAPDFADNKATTFVYDGRTVSVPLSGRPVVR